MGRSRDKQGIAADATAELETLRSQLVAQEPVRVVGKLALGVAHDLANVIGAIRLRLGTLELRELPEDAAADVAALTSFADDAAALVEDVQVLGRPPARGIGTVDVAAALARAVELVESALRLRAVLADVPFGIDLRVGDLPPVKGVASELRRTFVNLFINAAQAMPKGGTVRVRGAVRGGRVVLTIADQGGGFSREHLRRLFEPFFTTKGTDGMGLGLAMAREAIERAGGTITARNRRGGGAVFELRLVPAKR